LDGLQISCDSHNEKGFGVSEENAYRRNY
jgi:hypothetical protein